MERGERVQKYLSECGVASRRKAEELIAQGAVKINGRPAVLGDRIDSRRDEVAVHGRRVEPVAEKIYIMLNKPRGYVTTLQDERGRKCVAELVRDVGRRVYPVGRLDRDSEGLLLLTNDGAFSNLLMHPRGGVGKTYRVTVRGAAAAERLAPLRAGVLLDGRRTAPCEIDALERTEERTVLRFVLHEGRNRQIRRMCELAGLELLRLKRVAVGPLKLGMLPVGKWRSLESREVEQLLRLAEGQARREKIRRDESK